MEKATAIPWAQCVFEPWLHLNKCHFIDFVVQFVLFAVSNNICLCAWGFQYKFCIQDYHIGNWMSFKNYD